jgi:hypothetical protein
MADDRRFPHTRIPNFLFDTERYPDMTASMITTYAAARSFAYVRSKASDKFGRAWPSIPTIAKRARQSERQVQRNLRALEDMHLLYRKLRPFTSAIITFVDSPEAFEKALRERGLEAARAENEACLEEIREEAFGERARVSAEQRGNGVTVSPSPRHRDTRVDAPVSPPGCSRVTVRTQKEELRREEHKREEHGSDAVAPESPSLSPETSTEDQTREPGWLRRELRRLADTKRMPG